MPTGRPISLASVTNADIRATQERLPGVFGKSLPERSFTYGLWTAAIGFVIWLNVHFDFTPWRLLHPDARAGALISNFFDWSRIWGWAHQDIIASLLETVAMALLGTTLATIVALPLAFLTARNVLPVSIVRFMGRRLFDVARGVDQVIWALIFITAVGLGPMAGILAIFVSDAGTLGKLFSEAIENAERGQVEGIRATGAGPIATQRYGMLPQIFPVLISQALYFFESNTRSATVLGLVGAGGIGFELISRWNVLRYDEVAYIIVLITLTVSLIDYVSKFVRYQFIGKPDGRH
jgi:phosphonate transport system permease protein